MDVAEADADVKLYKASAELLLELQAKVPRLVQNHRKPGTFRKWVIDSKTYEVTRLLDFFQEWPQLLDPYLASLIQVLVDAYWAYCIMSPEEYLRKHKLRDQIAPLPRAVARVLYAFCKVRGRKVIVKLLNNEPKYVEPLLSCFRHWTAIPNADSSKQPCSMTWEERYIHLLWLSHLMLAPFELSTISVLSVDQHAEPIFPELYSDLPNVSINLATAGLRHLDASGKAREAASTLLVRLCLRSDMQKLGLMKRLVIWACRELERRTDQSHRTGYRHIGLLELLFGITNSASDAEIAPYLNQIFRIVYNAATSSDMHFVSIRDSAPARKLLVKVMRSVIVHAISVQETGPDSAFEIDVDTMLEDCIQSLLDFLADKDTPVRQASSKALSLICLKLDADMSSEVVEAVVDRLSENMLLEDLTSGTLFPITSISRESSSTYTKNLNAVNPLKWHGCMLTLGHLLFRKSLPNSLLPAVIDALLMGLNFEQRSNVGTSVGVGVRDAACFGIWSLARKFATAELSKLVLPISLLPYPATFSGTAETATVQLIANHLAVSACFDPSGNLRRGSSAALQELIGRHPDAIIQGIPVVQTIDYHAVARRSRAMTEVATAASKLSPQYHGALLYAILGWRGARATDAESRRLAGQAAGVLVASSPKDDALDYIRELVSQIEHLKPSNNGSNASARHGLMSCLAAILGAFADLSKAEWDMEIFNIASPVLDDIASLIGDVQNRVTTDIENVFESTSKTIFAYARFLSKIVEQGEVRLDDGCVSRWIESIEMTLNKCTISSDKDSVTDAASQANAAVFALRSAESQASLLTSWLDSVGQSKADFTCKGRAAGLGHIFKLLNARSEAGQQCEQKIAEYFFNISNSSYAIETKVNGMQSIAHILKTGPSLDSETLNLLLSAIKLGLTDYTVDQRGDVGSLLRLESIEAAQELPAAALKPDQRQQINQILVKLAAEKLIKVRFQAWKCLRKYLTDDKIEMRTFEHQTDVSSYEYFRNIEEFLQYPQYRQPLIAGLVSSLSGGSEDVNRACSEAILVYLQDQPVEKLPALLCAITESVTRNLVSTTSVDEFDVVSAVDFLAFLVEHILAYQLENSIDAALKNVWSFCQKVHTANSTIIRLEAVIRLYSGLVLIGTYRLPVLDKLTRLLLHRWPKVRSAAADALFMFTALELLPACDWNAPAAHNKSVVVALRKELRVAGSGASDTIQPSI